MAKAYKNMAYNLTDCHSDMSHKKPKTPKSHTSSAKPVLPCLQDDSLPCCEESELILSKGVLSFEFTGVGSLVYEGAYDQYKKKHGHGVLTWPDGRQYEGQFLKDVFHGEGAMTWPDGNKYIGHYANGLKDGDGILYLPNGSKLAGQFLEGKRHGQFIHTKPDGTEKLLQFNLDKLCDNSECTTRASETTNSSSSFDKKFLQRIQDEQEERRKLPTVQNPQMWRVVDRGGVVVRASSSLKSQVVGTIKQNEELLIVGASGRRLRVANPVEGWAIGWVSSETEGGLVVTERIHEVDQFNRSLQSAEKKQDQHQTKQNLKEYIYSTSYKQTKQKLLAKLNACL